MAKSNYSAVPSASLAKALSAVVRASGKDPYQMVHVQSENGKLSVRCFNGLMGILAIIAAEDKGNTFDATIDAQAFAALSLRQEWIAGAERFGGCHPQGHQ